MGCPISRLNSHSLTTDSVPLPLLEGIKGRVMTPTKPSPVKGEDFYEISDVAEQAAHRDALPQGRGSFRLDINS